MDWFLVSLDSEFSAMRPRTYNCPPARNVMNMLSDWTIWAIFSANVKEYRKSHWQHHLHLGDPLDTEVSYHNCLSPGFPCESDYWNLSGGIGPSAIFSAVFAGKTAQLPRIESHSPTKTNTMAPLLRH